MHWFSTKDIQWPQLSKFMNSFLTQKQTGKTMCIYSPFCKCLHRLFKTVKYYFKIELNFEIKPIEDVGVEGLWPQSTCSHISSLRHESWVWRTVKPGCAMRICGTGEYVAKMRETGWFVFCCVKTLQDWLWFFLTVFSIHGNLFLNDFFIMGTLFTVK